MGRHGKSLAMDGGHRDPSLFLLWQTRVLLSLRGEEVVSPTPGFSVVVTVVMTCKYVFGETQFVQYRNSVY